MKCVYCGKKLPMVKKLTSDGFCSAAHKQAYHDEQEQLALARLIEDNQKQKAVRKPLPKPKDLEPDPAFADFLLQGVELQTMGGGLHSFDPIVSIDIPRVLPGATCQLAEVHDGSDEQSISDFIGVIQGETSVEDAIRSLARTEAVEPSLQPIALLVPLRIEDPRDLDSEPAIEITIEPELPAAPQFNAAPLEAHGDPILPASRLKPWQSLPDELLDLTPTTSSQLPFDLARRFQPAPGYLEKRFSEPVSIPVPIPSIQPTVDGSWAIAGIPGPAEAETRFTESADWQPANLESVCRTVDSQPLPASVAVAGLPVVHLEPTSFGNLPDAGLIEPSAEIATGEPNAPRLLGDSCPPEIAIAVSGATDAVLAEPQLTSFGGPLHKIFERPEPCLPRTPGLAAAGEIPVEPGLPSLEFTDAATAAFLAYTEGKCQPFAEQFAHPDSFLRPSLGNWGAGNSAFGFYEPVPPKARVASVRRTSLSVLAKTFRASKQINISVHPDPGGKAPIMREFMRPERLQLHRPKSNLRIRPARTSNSAISALSHFGSGGVQWSWNALKTRWHDAPNDLRWIAMAVPLVIGLLWFAESPSAQHDAKGTISSVIPNVTGIVKTSFSKDSFEELKQNIQRRAAIELSDDFRQGLGEWSGEGDWARGWTYDPAGFIRPRKLALMSPSLSLQDYRFEFLGAIERKALSWVFRAADVKNYYVSRLEVTRGGPVPTVELVRYAVINGRPEKKQSIPLPMQVRTDTIYRIRVDVRGNDFVTSVQGQVVDVFSDDRLARGGVGFFSEPGEDARLRWVEVSHQYDMLGRLCAYLVPYNVSNSNVRSAP